MGESEYVPAAKDNLILFMTPCLQSYTDPGSAKIASVVSPESLVFSKMELGNNGKNVLNIRAPIVKCSKHNKLNI